jgi:CheY-like chemotaxis protein
VVDAPDGETALALARVLRPRAIVSDVMMPGMDGLALCRAVRSDPALLGTRIALVTAKAGPDDRMAGLEVADEFISKPFRMQELLARVRNLMQRPDPQGPRATTHPAPQAAPGDPATSGRAGDESPADPECDRALRELLRAAVVQHLADQDYSVPGLARAAAMSPRQLQRRCRDLTGQGPVEFIRAIRMEEARAMIARGAFRTVSEVAAAVGMSPSYFARLYAAQHGRPPSEDLRA